MKVTSGLIEAHVFRKQNDGIEFLLLKRSENENYGGIWQMVTGSIDEGEKAYDTALREIKEETGLTPEKLWVVPNVNSFYSPEKDALFMIPVFAALVNNDAVVISSEHSEYQWVDKEKAKSLLAWNGQRKSVDTIYQYFESENPVLYFNEINFR
ncbi:MAG TPA: NUDIX domain-containing protein [Melioribacteraceae bacterium]|nr:NUDIX domain-containing protein [Melioribacteraceae bacterium]